MPWEGGSGLFYVCFMDDIKTFIGRIGKGFDFLGYHFGPEGFTGKLKTKNVTYFRPG